MRTLLLAAAAYLLLTQMRPAGATAPAPQQPSTATTTPTGTRITIPGLGDYVNVGGGQATQISLDPGFWANLFGAGAAQPVPVSAAPAPADFGLIPEPAYAGDPSYYEWV